MKTKIFSSLFLTSIFLVAALPSVASAQYWSDPDTAPTGNNAAAPINVGSQLQYKAGSLSLGGDLLTQTDANVGIGFDIADYPYTLPTDALDVDGNIVATSSTDGGISPGNITARGNITAGGNLYGTAFYYTSDKRLKENIVPLQNSLSTIEKLQGVSFNWKKDQTPGIGFIAQDVDNVLPQIVSTNAQGYESVSYASVVPLLVEAVKEQQTEIEALQKQVSDLENK